MAYNCTDGSTLIASAAHAGLALGQNLVDIHPIPFGWYVLTFLGAAALVVLWDRFHTERSSVDLQIPNRPPIIGRPIYHARFANCQGKYRWGDFLLRLFI
jgi:hypothetical protein